MIKINMGADKIRYTIKIIKSPNAAMYFQFSQMVYNIIISYQSLAKNKLKVPYCQDSTQVAIKL